MMAFITYTMQIIMAFLMLTMISIMLPRAIVAAERIDEILESETVITDSKQPKMIDGRGEIEFHDVSFAYPDAEENVLEHISFTAKAGETTAFIGSTGSGKSTLIQLIPRMFDVTGGSITIDGEDIREISLKDLRKNIGYVPQKGLLFSGTIESNINFGVEEPSKEQMKKAAQIAQATEFIEGKLQGYETPIAQGGANVSGGQRQRLSIARAIAKDPKIYIFDDSFSALDYKTDVALRQALNKEIGDAAVLIVAQRISTILHADKIIVLDEGRIVGEGTHEELLKNNQVYQEIAKSQLSKKELEGEV
jgi:ATP-binding cassette subfamily B protein